MLVLPRASSKISLSRLFSSRAEFSIDGKHLRPLWSRGFLHSIQVVKVLGPPFNFQAAYFQTGSSLQHC
jgi:hypothetical protein